MLPFLNETIEWNQFELIIDKSIFDKDIVLKTAYNFLDKWYFFFKIDENGNILVQYTAKDWVKENPKDIIWDFSDELLSVYLRDKLERDNKTLRELIVWTALSHGLDENNFIEINTDVSNGSNQNQLDFDKDIDDILKAIENDSDLDIDGEEIRKILEEIEEESKKSEKVQNISLDVNAIKDAKKTFQDR